MNTHPLVSVIVPTRNEAADIEGCLDAIAAQDHPVNRLEVVVVDGCSDDGTVGVVRRCLGRYGFGVTAVLSNECRTTSSNLNLGLARATGDIVCRVDARTRIEKHYVRTCVEVLTDRPDVVVVGGAQISMPRDPRAKSIGIARALNNRWSMGGSPYRRATTSGPADTVYLGAFRRAELVDEGGWDEALSTNQDFDLNRRMARRGLVWFEASLRSGYLPRPTFGLLWRQYLRFGRAKVLYWRLTGERPERRQWMLLVGPPAAAVVAAGAIAAGSGRRSWLATGAVAALLGLAALERVGASEPRGGFIAHLNGIVAMAIVGGGWWCGAAAAGVLALTGRAEAVVDPTTAGSASEAPPGA